MIGIVVVGTAYSIGRGTDGFAPLCRQFVNGQKMSIGVRIELSWLPKPK